MTSLTGIECFPARSEHLQRCPWQRLAVLARRYGRRPGPRCAVSFFMRELSRNQPILSSIFFSLNYGPMLRMRMCRPRVPTPMRYTDSYWRLRRRRGLEFSNAVTPVAKTTATLDVPRSYIKRCRRVSYNGVLTTTCPDATRTDPGNRAPESRPSPARECRLSKSPLCHPQRALAPAFPASLRRSALNAAVREASVALGLIDVLALDTTVALPVSKRVVLERGRATCMIGVEVEGMSEAWILGAAAVAAIFIFRGIDP